MKTPLAAIVTCFILATTAVYATEDHHQGGKTKDAMPGMMHGQGMGMKHHESMQEHMKKMHELMDRMHATRDPAKRHELMREHREEMGEAMTTMHGMRWQERDCPSDKMNTCIMNRQNMMQQRMDMMQQMMEQMMERDSMPMER